METFWGFVFVKWEYFDIMGENGKDGLDVFRGCTAESFSFF